MILLINICKEKLHFYEFVKPIEDILEKKKLKFKTKHYSQIVKKDLAKAEKIIICGTSLKDNEFLDNVRKFDWITDFPGPILGICGGSHIIGRVLGHQLKKKTEIGLKEIEFKKEFLGFLGKRQVYHLHNLQVLPEIFHEKNIYSVLFHPEVRNREMILNFARL